MSRPKHEDVRALCLIERKCAACGLELVGETAWTLRDDKTGQPVAVCQMCHEIAHMTGG